MGCAVTRPDDVCALCDHPISGDPGWNARHWIMPLWNPGFVHGTRGKVAVHHGCIYLADGRYDDILADRAFEDTPIFENLAAWARRTFAPEAPS